MVADHVNLSPVFIQVGTSEDCMRKFIVLLKAIAQGVDGQKQFKSFSTIFLLKNHRTLKSAGQALGSLWEKSKKIMCWTIATTVANSPAVHTTNAIPKEER